MILAVDTATSVPAVAAVERDGTVLFAGSGQRARAHAEDLPLLVAHSLLDRRAGDIDHVVVGRGPGAFTGLRVGLAFARTWGWAAQVPVTGVCSLDAVALAHDLGDGWVVLDARRGEMFAARYRFGLRQGAPEVLPRAEAVRRAGTDLVVGDVELLGSPDRRASGHTRMNPIALAALAVRAVQVDPEGSVAPEYLRRPDVTLSPANTQGSL